MEVNLLHTNISYLKGVGPKKAEILGKELKVFTFMDMLNQFPGVLPAHRYYRPSAAHRGSKGNKGNSPFF